jgi:hypothetical protein
VQGKDIDMTKTQRILPQAPKTPKRRRPPTIRVAVGEMPKAVDNIVMRLDRIENFYRHRDRFVRAVRDGDTVTLLPLSLAELQTELDSAFVFLWSERREDGSWIDVEIVNCPVRVASLLMKRATECTVVPEIASVVDIEKVSA